MRELFTMWRDGRMIGLTAVIAAVYMAGLILFKGLVIVPGFTEIRPANVLPVALSLMFGPAAAWGSAIGNLMGDAFGGTLSAGSVFGFVGNFFTGYVGYKLWGNLGPLSTNEDPSMRSPGQLAEFVVVSFVAAAGTGAIIAWGLELLGLFPFSVFATIITVNDFLAAAVIGAPLLYVLYPRIEDAGLRYTDLMDEDDLPDVPPGQRQSAAVGLAGVAVVWLFVGIVISVGLQGVPFWLGQGAIEPGTGGSLLQTVVGTLGFVLLIGFSALTAREPPRGLLSGGRRRAERGE